MKINTSIKHLLICATSVMALTSCGGGNDVASGGAGTGVTSASAVTAGAPNSAVPTTTSSTANVAPTKAAMDRVGFAIPTWANAAVQAVFNDISSQQTPNDITNGKYSVDKLVAAFANNNFFDTNLSTTQQVYNITAFLANSGHETGGGYPPNAPFPTGWQYLTELGPYTNSSGTWSTNGQGILTGPVAACQANYTDPTKPSAPGVCYYGRGSMQLSWNYNYAAYAANSGNGIALNVFNNPDLIVTDLLWDSGAWFWSNLSQSLTPGGSRPGAYFGLGDPSTYNTADPMGKAINVVNGALECASPGNTNAQDRINRFVAWLPLVAKAAGVTITTYNTAQTVGVSCVGPYTPPAPKSQGLTVNFNNTSASSLLITLGNPFYDYPPFPPGTTTYNQNSSGNLAQQFPTTAPVAVKVYLNRGSAANPPVACSGTIAATGVSYTITANQTSCSISGPTFFESPAPIFLLPY